MKHARHIFPTGHHTDLSVLSVEPYGMKRYRPGRAKTPPETFSALGRAVWDETARRRFVVPVLRLFQCSRSSRMG